MLHTMRLSAVRILHCKGLHGLGLRVTKTPRRCVLAVLLAKHEGQPYLTLRFRYRGVTCKKHGSSKPQASRGRTGKVHFCRLCMPSCAVWPQHLSRKSIRYHFSQVHFNFRSKRQKCRFSMFSIKTLERDLCHMS